MLLHLDAPPPSGCLGPLLRPHIPLSGLHVIQSVYESHFLVENGITLFAGCNLYIIRLATLLLQANLAGVRGHGVCVGAYECLSDGGERGQEGDREKEGTGEQFI